MRFIAFSAFVVATVSATWIYPSTHSNCQPQDVPTISACNDTDLLNYNIAGARIVYDGQTVTWFKQKGCQGARVSVGASNDCFPLLFTPRCVRIVC